MRSPDDKLPFENQMQSKLILYAVVDLLNCCVSNTSPFEVYVLRDYIPSAREQTHSLRSLQPLVRLRQINDVMKYMRLKDFMWSLEQLFRNRVTFFQLVQYTTSATDLIAMRVLFHEGNE